MCQTHSADPCPFETPPKKKRERRHPSDYLYVRKNGRGETYQARAWLTGLGSVNLGCHASEWSAGQASKAFVARALPGVPLADVLDSLRRDGLVPAHVRMKFVHDLPDGAGFGAKVKKCGRVIELPGPYPTEREAHEAMVAHLDSLGPMTPVPKQPTIVPVKRAARELGIKPREFEKDWSSVFSDPRKPVHCDSPMRAVYADELSAAVEAGGGHSEEARVAVATFRMAVGRLGWAA